MVNKVITSTADLQELLARSAENDTPVYVYSEPKGSGISIDLRGFNRILEIDTANLVATVEPGVTAGELSDELKKEGLRFVPADTAIYRHKTVGELFYEGCSNISSLKYGSTKHFLMGLEVVLPSGELLKTGAKTVKNVTGYDMTRFFSSPYNNLGIGVKFLLKLLPIQEKKQTAVFSFENTCDMFNFIDEFRNSRITPASAFWLDPLVSRSLHQGSPAGQALIIEVDGVEEEVDKQYGELKQLAEKNHGAEEQPLALESLLANGFQLVDELKFPNTLVRHFVKNFYSLAASFEVEAGLFGQAAEGKLNVRLSQLGTKEKNFIERLLQWSVEIGGFSSGKYQRQFGGIRDGALFALEQQVRKSFDPLLILNR